MASTPSAPALSAVLRCRGNIWTRNPPSKRPATAGYSLGLAGGATRDSPDERTGPNGASGWEALVKGERVVVTGRQGVTYRPPRVPADVLREKDFRRINALDCLKQLPGDAHSAAHRLTRDRPARAKITFKRVCKVVFAQETSRCPFGVSGVPILSRGLMENAGHLVETLRRTCLTLTVLVAQVMMLWRSRRSSSSPDGASQHQANGNTHSPTDLTSSKCNFGCGQKITEDRPD